MAHNAAVIWSKVEAIALAVGIVSVYTPLLSESVPAKSQSAMSWLVVASLVVAIAVAPVAGAAS